MKKLLCAALVVTLTACATTGNRYAANPYRPIIDTQGVDMGKLEADLTTCNDYAGRIDVAEDAFSGMLAGALVGAALGRAYGRQYVGQGARLGAISAGVSSAAKAQTDKMAVVKNCMHQRGYKALD